MNVATPNSAPAQASLLSPPTMTRPGDSRTPLTAATSYEAVVPPFPAFPHHAHPPAVATLPTDAMPPPLPASASHIPYPVCRPTATSANPYALMPNAIYSTNLAAVASMSLAPLQPSELVFKARLALQAERYDEMAFFMRVLCLQKASPLSTEERSLFALAYKKLLGARRMGWRYMYSIEMKDKAATRKLEAEIARETEREAREQRERDQAKLSSPKDDAKEALMPFTTDTFAAKLKATTSSNVQSAVASSTVASPPSVVPVLQARLAALTTNLQHTHSYRYQLFYESSLIISEVSSLLFERLLPRLLTNQNEDIFLRLLPNIIEQLIAWEKKRSARPKQTQQAAAKANVNATIDKPSTTAAATAESTSTLGTPAIASMPIVPPLSNVPLTKLDTSRHWSLEVEFDLQLRALDDRTRFLSSLRSVHAESLVFYCKMLADHRRLLAEFLTEREYEEQERASQSLYSLAYYVLARWIAGSTLRPSNPIRLGLHLNFSMFYFEVLAKPDRASQMASQAYDQALQEWQNHRANAPAAASTAGSASVSASSSVATNLAGSAGSSTQGLSGVSSSNNLAGGGSADVGVANGACGAGTTSAAAAAALLAGTYKDSLLVMQLLKNNLTIWAQSL